MPPHSRVPLARGRRIKIAQTRPRERGSGQLGDGGSPNGIPSHVLPQSKFLTHLLNIIREGRWTPGATEAAPPPGASFATRLASCGSPAFTYLHIGL